MALLKILFLPPTGLIFLILLGVLLRRRSPRFAKLCLVSGSGLLFLLSLPAVGTSLLMLHQDYAPLSLDDVLRAPRAPGGPQAIAVLGASFLSERPEYGQAQPGALTFPRLRYGAYLQRLTGLPLLVSAGRAGGIEEPGAVIMKRSLEDELSAEVAFVEQTSLNTWENAAYSASMARRAGIEHVFLVTHAWHMPRAKYAFERHGLAVTPAPTAFATPSNFTVFDWLPSPVALRNSYFFFHEALGRIAYRFR